MARIRRAPISGALRPRAFLELIPDRARPKLPDDLRGFEWRQRWSLLQLWYGANARIHYEVWFHRRIERLEVGLHFEADPATNARLLEHFDSNLIVAKALISERVEAEGWDRGWARVYQMLPLARLDEGYLDRVAGALARTIEVLQPLMEEVGADT